MNACTDTQASSYQSRRKRGTVVEMNKMERISQRLGRAKSQRRGLRVYGLVLPYRIIYLHDIVPHQRGGACRPSKCHGITCAAAAGEARPETRVGPDKAMQHTRNPLLPKRIHVQTNTSDFLLGSDRQGRETGCEPQARAALIRAIKKHYRQEEKNPDKMSTANQNPLIAKIGFERNSLFDFTCSTTYF